MSFLALRPLLRCADKAYTGQKSFIKKWHIFSECGIFKQFSEKVHFGFELLSQNAALHASLSLSVSLSFSLSVSLSFLDANRCSGVVDFFETVPFFECLCSKKSFSCVDFFFRLESCFCSETKTRWHKVKRCDV